MPSSVLKYVEIPPYSFIIPNSLVVVSYRKYVPLSDTNDCVVKVGSFSKKFLASFKYSSGDIYPCLHACLFNVLFPLLFTKSTSGFLFLCIVVPENCYHPHHTTNHRLSPLPLPHPATAGSSPAHSLSISYPASRQPSG